MAQVLEIKNLTKRFPQVLANDNVDLSVEKGEIRAVLGENGAGKSTLMSCIYGLYGMDSGEIRIEGSRADINSCDDAIRLGIGMANQHFMLVQKLSVVENVVLGLKTKTAPMLDYKGSIAAVRELSDRYGFNIDPEEKIENLAVGLQQRVEILKILYRKSRIMIFDEPTAVLTPNEVLEFFEILKQFKSEGRTILFITHKLKEVMKICDSVTVLRDGKVVGDVLVDETNTNELAKMMVGREINLKEAEQSACIDNVVFQVKDLYVKNYRGQNAVNGLNFSLRRGEILGIAGVDGNGQLELGRAITGMQKIDSGSVLINGEDVSGLPPDKLLAYGLSHIPPDRQKTGLILDFSVEDNLASKTIHLRPFSKAGFIRRKAIRESGKNLIGQFNIRGCRAATIAKQLSGGNQQKIILAREFSRKPKIIIAIQPTRGLDISAIEFVRRELIEQRDNGAAILLISTELEEIIALSDRIEVIYEGEFTGELAGHDVDPLDIGLQMAGKKRSGGA